MTVCLSLDVTDAGSGTAGGSDADSTSSDVSGVFGDMSGPAGVAGIDMSVFDTLGDSGDDSGLSGGAAGGQVILDGILDSGVLGDEQSPDALKGEALGDRKSPTQKALDNGTSVRKVILTKEGSAGLSFPWWIILLILGTYGAKKYIEHEDQKKKEEEKNG